MTDQNFTELVLDLDSDMHLSEDKTFLPRVIVTQMTLLAQCLPACVLRYITPNCISGNHLTIKCKSRTHKYQ
jgi:hypothetical protein